MRQYSAHYFQSDLPKEYTVITAKTEILNCMAALDERDYVTAGHARRLGFLCKQIGHKINLPPKQIDRLLLLSQTHDLGKVCIPDQILYKPGLLNPKESKIMRSHSEKGYRIASDSAALQGIADLILRHHERWDGAGYPLGIKGGDIPVECRILAIVDAFDAMTNERPYRKPIPVEQALREIGRCAGSQFDPDLAALFLKFF